MRSRSQGRRHRSVDRGTCGPGIQPRKNLPPGCRRCKEKRKAQSRARISARCAPVRWSGYVKQQRRISSCGSLCTTSGNAADGLLLCEEGSCTFTKRIFSVSRTRAQPASSAGCALHWTADEESELGARSGYPRLFRWAFPRMAGEVHRAPDRRPARCAIHPEMAERGRAGGEADTCGGRDAARAGAHRRCWPTFTFIMYSTCGFKRGVGSGRTAM